MRAIYNHTRFHILRDTIYAPTAADVAVIDAAACFFSFFFLFFFFWTIFAIFLRHVRSYMQSSNRREAERPLKKTQCLQSRRHVESFIILDF